MSVCLVATYPWENIRAFPGLGSPGAIVCSDTRVVSDGRPLSIRLSKQRLNARNVLVCYTSSHVAATQSALNAAFGTRNVKRIGQALKNVHGDFGGATELIAVVSPGASPPQVLEVMPPEYLPRPRDGVVGIGDPDVLDWLKENFPSEAPQDSVELSPEALKSLEDAVGGPVSFPPPSFTIDAAALRSAAALSEGITQVGGKTVQLPIQVMTVQSGVVRSLGVSSTADLEVFDDVTAKPDELKIRKFALSRIDKDDLPRRAIQVLP